MTLASVLLRCRHVVRRCVHRQISIDDIDSDAIVDAFCFTIGAVLTLRFDTSNTAQIITMRPEQLQLTIKKTTDDEEREYADGIEKLEYILQSPPQEKTMDEQRMAMYTEAVNSHIYLRMHVPLTCQWEVRAHQLLTLLGRIQKKERTFHQTNICFTIHSPKNTVTPGRACQFAVDPTYAYSQCVHRQIDRNIGNSYYSYCP